MKKVLLTASLLAIVALNCSWHKPEAFASPASEVSIELIPRSPVFDINQVPQGAVRFTALIRNKSGREIKIAHPGICFPADYKPGETRRREDARGKSEILVTIAKPDGSEIVFRDGSMHFFDPGNIPFITIPPRGIGSFGVGWFFPNERGRWERDDEAANVFLMKGKYTVTILFRNMFPRAAAFDKNTGQSGFMDVWTGEMKSRAATIEVM